MVDVLISYSRAELEFVAHLAVGLKSEGLGVWVDIDGLYPGEEFWPEVAKAIDAAATFVFVLTPDSIASEFCLRELDRAIEGHKRIVPLLRRDVDARTLHLELAKRQWVFFREGDDPDAALGALLSAVRADWIQLREQARLLERAREWQARQRDASLLLHGRDLYRAQAWLAQARGSGNEPAALHCEYIETSHAASRHRVLRLAGAAAVAVVAISVATWLGLEQRVDSLNNLGVIDLSEGTGNEAIDNLELANSICTRVRSLLPGCPDVATNLGSAYSRQNRHDEAFAQFSRVLNAAERVNASGEAALSLRARAYQERAYTRIMQAELQSEDTKRLEGYQHAENDQRNAAEIYQHLLPDPERRFVAITRARLHLGRAQYDRALEELESLGEDHSNENVALLLSLAHHCLGDGPKSVSYFERYMGLLKDQRQRWLLIKDYDNRIRQRCNRD